MNVIFIGMPGSGKTTLSRQTAAQLERPWYDSDAEIEARAGRTIAEIFAKDGENVFRTWETGCITELLKKENIVLAVGGGAVEKNGEVLRNGGFVIYIDRPISEILKTLKPGERPLLEGGAEARLKLLYERRHTLYENICHARVSNSGTPDEALAGILEAVKGVTA